jgi:hypothetical protein
MTLDEGKEAQYDCLVEAVISGERLSGNIMFRETRFSSPGGLI